MHTFFTTIYQRIPLPHLPSFSLFHTSTLDIFLFPHRQRVTKTVPFHIAPQQSLRHVDGICLQRGTGDPAAQRTGASVVTARLGLETVHLVVRIQ